MKEKYFDGYNTVVRHRYCTGVELVRYVQDGWYCGGDDVFAVRLASTREDIECFKTFRDALAFWKKCEAIIREHGLYKLLAKLYPDAFGTNH